MYSQLGMGPFHAELTSPILSTKQAPVAMFWLELLADFVETSTTMANHSDNPV